MGYDAGAGQGLAVAPERGSDSRKYEAGLEQILSFQFGEFEPIASEDEMLMTVQGRLAAYALGRGDRSRP